MHSYTKNKNFSGEVNWVHQALIGPVTGHCLLVALL